MVRRSSTSKAKKSSEKSVTDSKYDELDRKWTDRFSRLEALLIHKTLQPTVQPTFSSAVKVNPSHSQLSCVTNVTTAAQNLPVDARLQNFWQTWLDLGAGQKVLQILKEGYTLPFRIQPNSTGSPTIISCYVSPHRNLYMLEASAYRQKRSRTSRQSKISGVFQPTFLPKPKKWRPIIDLSKLNLFLEAENGDTGNLQDIPPTKGVGYLNRLKGCLLPYTYTGTVEEIS